MRKPVTKPPQPAKARVPAPTASATTPKRAVKFLPALPVEKVMRAKPQKRAPTPTARVVAPKRLAKAKPALPAAKLSPVLPAEATALPEPKPGITAKPSEKAAKAVSKGRDEPLNFRVTADFRRAFKRAAAAQDCKKVELLELIFNEWTARNTV